MGGGRTRAYKRKQKTISLLFFVVATGYLLSFSKIDWREVLFKKSIQNLSVWRLILTCNPQFVLNSNELYLRHEQNVS